MPDRPSSERWTIWTCSVCGGDMLPSGGAWYCRRASDHPSKNTPYDAVPIQVVPRELLDRLIEAGERYAESRMIGTDINERVQARAAWDAAVREAQGE